MSGVRGFGVWTRVLGFGASLLCGIATAQPADADAQAAAEARATFEELYADQVAAVGATRQADDDVALAGELLAVAERVKAQPHLLALICEQAYRLGIQDESGCRMAINAIRLIEMHAPKQAAAMNTDDKIFAAYQRWYAGARGELKTAAAEEMVRWMVQVAQRHARAGETESALRWYRRGLGIAGAMHLELRTTIQQHIEAISQRRKAELRLNAIKQRLQQNRDDAATIDELFHLLIVVMDAPAEARKYSFLADEATQQLIRWANAEPATLTADQALKLGGWYEQFARRATQQARLTMLEHARDYYRIGASAKETSPLVNSRAAAQLDRVEGEIADLLGGAVDQGDVALASRGAEAVAENNAPALIDGDATNYTGTSGFASGTWPCQFVVKLAQRYMLREIRIRLWDGDSRSYRYAVDVSPDGQSFTPLIDRSRGASRSWQTLRFNARPVQFIRIRGLHNTANSGFHIVEVQAYCHPTAP